MLIENGGMRPLYRSILWAAKHRSPAAILQDDDDPVVAEEAKAIFYAHAELEVRYLFMELRSLTNYRSTWIPGRSDSLSFAPRTVKVFHKARYR